MQWIPLIFCISVPKRRVDFLFFVVQVKFIYFNDKKSVVMGDENVGGD